MTASAREAPLTPPGYGGRIYFRTAVGKGFYVLQVMPRGATSGK